MDDLDDIISGSSSGSGSCNEASGCNDGNESRPDQFPLWLIFFLSLVSLFLIFCVILLIVLLMCRFGRVDRPKKRYYGFKGDKRHGRKAPWNDILNEIHVTFKVRDKSEDEDIGPNSIQVIPTINSFKAKRTQEQTTTFINERREDDEDENKPSLLPQACVNSIVFEGERSLAVQDPTYDRLAGTSNSSNTNTVTTNKRQSENEPGIKEDINRRSTVISSHQSLNRTVPEKEERDYDDILTSSMGPGRRLTTLSDDSKDRNSLYYIYIPKDGENTMDNVYSVPNSLELELRKLELSIEQEHTYCNLHSSSLDQIDDKVLEGRTTLTKSLDLDVTASDAEKDSSQTGLSPTYLKIIPSKSGDETPSHYQFINDEPKVLLDQRESRVYQAIDDDLVQSQAEPTQNVYTLPNEYDDIKGPAHLPQPPSCYINGDRAEGVYCHIDDDGSPCYDDVDIYTVPTDPSQIGSAVMKGKHNSIYYTSIDDLREEGGSGDVNETGGYSYAATHELISPSRHSKGEEEKGEIKSDGRFTNDSGYTYAAGLQLVAMKPSMGSVKEKPKEQSVPNPLYSTKSLSLPHDHSYENTNRFLPPRRHSEKEYVAPKTQWFRSGSLNDILDIDKSPEEDEKEYLESSKEWVEKKTKGRFQIDGDSSAYTPVMARLMYNHDYMLPSSVSHSQPTDSELEASTHADWETPEKWRSMSLNASKQGEEKKSKGKTKDKKKSEGPVGSVRDEKHKYQNWRMFNQSK